MKKMENGKIERKIKEVRRRNIRKRKNIRKKGDIKKRKSEVSLHTTDRPYNKKEIRETPKKDYSKPGHTSLHAVWDSVTPPQDTFTIIKEKGKV